MKKMIILFIMAISQVTFAAIKSEITCKLDGRVLSVVQSAVGTNYTITKNRKLLASSSFTESGEGVIQDGPNTYSYALFFMSEDSNVIGVNIDGLRSRIPGQYEAYASVYIGYAANADVFESDDLKCQVKLK